MAHSSEKILALFSLLDEQIADDLETETLDFQEYPTEAKLRDLAKSLNQKNLFISKGMARVLFGTRSN